MILTGLGTRGRFWWRLGRCWGAVEGGGGLVARIEIGLVEGGGRGWAVAVE